MVTNPATRKIFLILIALSAWFALILQLYIIIKNGLSAGVRPLVSISNFFSYFTILSNFGVAISLTAVLLVPSSAAGKFFSKVSARTAIAVYIFIVGLVYNLVLRNIWSPTGWQWVADNLLHVVVPLFYVLFWYLFTPRNMLHWKNLFPWLIFPACYLAYSLVRGAATGWYPYPFVHADEMGYAKVAVNSMMVLLAFVAVGLGMIGINRVAKRVPDSKS